MPNERFIPPKPGDIQIEKIEIINFDGSEKQNLVLTCRELNIYESIYSDHIRADLVVEDALALTTRMPIIGEETVSVKFRTPSIQPNSFTYEWIEMAFKVIRLERLEPTNIRDAVYKLEMVSKEQVLNMTGTIQEAFGPEPISSTVKKIAKNYLGISNIDVSSTEGTHQFVIPNMKPFTAMSFLANEAQSSTYKPSNFIFYQDHKMFRFKPIDALIQAPIREQYFFYEQSLPAEQQPNRNETGVANTTAELFTDRKNPSDFRTMTDLSFDTIFDTEQTIMDGMFDSTTWHIDPLLQKFEPTEVKGEPKFNYMKTFSDFQHTSKSIGTSSGSDNPLISTKSQLLNLGGNSHHRYLITNKYQDSTFQVYPRRRQDFLPWLVSARNQLAYIVCRFTVPGDSDRKAGDQIFFDLHEFGATDDVIGKLNEYLSGAYLVTSVRHIYSSNSPMPFLTVMECVKNCYEKQIQRADAPQTSGTTPTSDDLEFLRFPQVEGSE